MNSLTGVAKTCLLLLRIGIGWLFIYAGWTKVITFFTEAKDWTAAGFLNSLEGAFASFFASMAGNVVVDQLNAWGLLLIGVAVTLGLLVRFASFWGFILMIIYWLAVFPPKRAFLVDDHIIYALVFLVLAATGAGRYWGLDKAVESSSLVKQNSWLVKILG